MQRRPFYSQAQQPPCAQQRISFLCTAQYNMTKSEDLTYVVSSPGFPASSFCLFTTVQKHYLYRIKTWRWGRPANIPYVSEPVSYGFVFLETRVRQEFALSKHFSNTGTDFLIFCVLFKIPRSTQSSFSALHVAYCLQQLYTET